MARSLRIEYPGAFYHVINRGNSGESIFRSKSDREKFLEYLGKAVERFSIKFHTYCLMPTHYHLLVETPQPNLSKAMQWINVSYATYFNRKRQRWGHLFQGRFKSILVDADEYLKHLSRYIHLNPVRAKLVESPSQYPWSSYSALVGKGKAPTWLETGWLLSQFGQRKSESARNYMDFVEKVEVDELEDPEKNLVGGFILGSPDFVNRIREDFLSFRSDDREITRLANLKTFTEKQAIVKAVSEGFGCTLESILKKGKKKNTPRDVTIYLARDMTGETCKMLGEFFGGISGAAVTVRYNHMSKELEGNAKFKSRVDRLRKRIVNN